MKNFLKHQAWPVVAGLLTAFVIMSLFEYVNSLFYPLPDNLDWTDQEAVWAFTASLPFSAFILVLLGWIVGSFSAGYLTTHLSGEKAYRLSLVVGVILTILGVINNLMVVGHGIVFNLIGLPMFLIFTYLGHRYQIGRHKKTAEAVS